MDDPQHRVVRADRRPTGSGRGDARRWRADRRARPAKYVESGSADLRRRMRLRPGTSPFTPLYGPTRARLTRIRTRAAQADQGDVRAAADEETAARRDAGGEEVLRPCLDFSLLLGHNERAPAGHTDRRPGVGDSQTPASTGEFPLRTSTSRLPTTSLHRKASHENHQLHHSGGMHALIEPPARWPGCEPTQP